MSSIIVGVPKEIKDAEYRVSLTPDGAGKLRDLGAQVLVQEGSGQGAGFSDRDYVTAGARLISTAQKLFRESELILKVKEPLQEERNYLTQSHTLFTFLHLGADAKQTKDLMESGATCIAYESVKGPDGSLPLLSPMSAIAGRISIQAGAKCLEYSMGGAGILLSGAPGVEAAKVTIIGGGIVGRNAAQIAIGMGADVTILDTNERTLTEIGQHFGPSVTCALSTPDSITENVVDSDLVIGAVLLPGDRAPKLITKEHIQEMKAGSVIVDVAIDQGGCAETSQPTTHSSPTYLVDGVVHYCVANMPGAVPRTGTDALTTATLPYIETLVKYGVKEALLKDSFLMDGVNICSGSVCEPAVANAHSLIVDNARELVANL